MQKKRLLIQLVFMLLAISIILPQSTTLAFDGEDEWEYAQDMCTLVDHYWLAEDYPTVNTDTFVFSGSLSIGGIGFTFDIDTIEPGSTWSVNFNNQFDLEAVVDEFGRAMVYYGLWSYGSYPYTSTFTSPSSETMDGPSGTVTVNDAETLDCSTSYLPHAISQATQTPVPSPVVIASGTPDPDEIEEPVVPIEDSSLSDLSDMEVPYGEAIIKALTSLWYYFCLCVILIVAIIIGIIIYIRRRKNRDLAE